MGLYDMETGSILVCFGAPLTGCSAHYYLARISSASCMPLLVSGLAAVDPA